MKRIWREKIITGWWAKRDFLYQFYCFCLAHLLIELWVHQNSSSFNNKNWTQLQVDRKSFLIKTAARLIECSKLSQSIYDFDVKCGEIWAPINLSNKSLRQWFVSRDFLFVRFYFYFNLHSSNANFLFFRLVFQCRLIANTKFNLFHVCPYIKYVIIENL